MVGLTAVCSSPAALSSPLTFAVALCGKHSPRGIVDKKQCTAVVKDASELLGLVVHRRSCARLLRFFVCRALLRLRLVAALLLCLRQRALHRCLGIGLGRRRLCLLQQRRKAGEERPWR